MAASASTKRAAKRKSSKPDPGDVVRIGLQAATAKANLPHSQWASIVNAAHQKGYTVASAIDPQVPDALKARTKSSLRTQADQTVTQAYKPQEAQLDYATQQANGLQAKRISDESSFNSWFAQKQAEQNDRIQKAQADYQTAVNANADAQIKNAGDTSTGLATQVQQGASGDMSNSVYLKDAQDRQQARIDAANAAKTQAVGTGATAQRNEQANIAAISGRHDAALGNIYGDYGKTISDVTDAKMKLSSSKASDSIKAYTDLLDQEASKASSQQQYTGLMAQLAQKSDAQQTQNEQFYAGLQSKDKQSIRNAQTTRQNAQTQADTSVAVAKINASAKALDRDLKASEGQKNRNTQLRIAKMNHQTNPDGTPSDAAMKYSESQVQVLHTIANIIHKYGPKFRDKQGHVTDTRSALISRGYSGSQINGGLWLAQKHHINDSLAKQLGILPQNRG